MSWPDKVFLESTALFQLGARLENVELAELIRLRDHLSFELAVAEVSWREYLRRREKEVRDCLAKLRQCKSELVKHGQPVTDLEQAEQNVSKYLDNIRDSFLQKAKSLKIAIVPTAAIDIHKLTEMSLGSVPPFEDSQSDAGEKTKEKGFRDALIMFTILEHTRSVPDTNGLVVTRDNRLAEGFGRFAPEYNAQLEVVPNLQTAVSHIYGKVEQWYRKKLEQETAEAKSALLEHRDQISQTVRQIRDLTEDDLGQGVLSRVLGRAEERINIQELRSVSFDMVESALWKDKDKAVSRILFKIRCLAHVFGTPVVPSVEQDNAHRRRRQANELCHIQYGG